MEGSVRGLKTPLKTPLLTNSARDTRHSHSAIDFKSTVFSESNARAIFTLQFSSRSHHSNKRLPRNPQVMHVMRK